MVLLIFWYFTRIFVLAQLSHLLIVKPSAPALNTVCFSLKLLRFCLLDYSAIVSLAVCFSIRFIRLCLLGYSTRHSFAVCLSLTTSASAC